MNFCGKLFYLYASIHRQRKKIHSPIMNQLNKSILRDEIQWLLEAITEQFDAINAYEDKIPQIEFDIIMENIRKLYENLHMLNREGDSFRHFVEPHVPEVREIEQPPSLTEKPQSQSGIKIKVETTPSEQKSKEKHNIVENDTTEIELFPSEMVEFSEKLKETRERTYASERVSSQRKELKAGISINEKFLFINELFDGNLRDYNITIETLNGFMELRPALEFLDLLRVKNLWEGESVAFKRLRELVEKKF